MSSISLIKLGGSLITDKREPRTARREVISRVAAEVRDLRRESPSRWIVGHGSGSFGHVEAARHRVQDGFDSVAQLPGIAATAQAAAELHRLLVAALLEAGAAPFSYAPSSAVVAENRVPVTIAVEPLLRSLELGLLPVVYGDVVMDRTQGCAICSTESVFVALVRELRRDGRNVDAVYWFGETDGVLDRQGEVISSIRADSAEQAIEAARGAVGTDVTGGMHHRLTTALDLARLGVRSWIGSGLESGSVVRAARGECDSGTWVLPSGPASEPPG